MNEITATEALKVLYKHGSFYEERTTDYGTTHHCPEKCGWYSSGCRNDPVDHAPTCKLGQALRMAEQMRVADFKAADFKAAEALNTKCRFACMTTSPCPDEATHISDTGYKSCEKHAPRDRDGKIEARVSLIKPFMKCEIFICTFRRDFEYLKWCLRSIAKFATGFSGVTIVVPEQDVSRAFDLIGVTELFGRRIHLRTGTEWPTQGFLWHMWRIMEADQVVPDTTTHICHLDPDCVFTEPVTPARFFRNGKPVLRYDTFVNKIAREPNIERWQEACNAALPFPVLNETMCGHPEIYHVGLYNVARQLIEQKTGRPLAEYMKTCKNSFPQTFAEFPTLGAVAMQCFSEFYHLHQIGTGDDYGLNEYPCFQAWSHNPPDKSTHLWWRGVQRMMVPADFYKDLGL